MRVLRSHWLWFVLGLSIVSALDYWDHISRPGSAFSEAAGDWLGFTLASHTSFCVIALSFAWLLGKTQVLPLVADTLAIAIAIAIHMVVIGPLWDRIFWDGGLMFDSVVMPVLIGCVLYLTFRLVFAIVSRLRFKRPSPAE